MVLIITILFVIWSFAMFVLGFGTAEKCMKENKRRRCRAEYMKSYAEAVLNSKCQEEG